MAVVVIHFFVVCGCIVFHLNLVENPVSLLLKHPEQGNMTYYEYVQTTKFHSNMQGMISNH